MTLKKLITQKIIEQERKKGVENYKINKKTINELIISTYLSKITLNVNRHMVAEWIKKKEKTHVHVTNKRCTSEEDTQTESEGWKKIFYENENFKSQNSST